MIRTFEIQNVQISIIFSGFSDKMSKMGNHRQAFTFYWPGEHFYKPGHDQETDKYGGDV